ncbi:MAG TPA: FAD binding domain-containing protein [Spirochaetales bacterium]|nr:FAD binding domain-containing protein [Spirochaetales bacterium]HPM71791.1 FAD binding domain-containing protein [Spirochaetales bacterium]
MIRTINFRLNESEYHVKVREEALALDWIRNEAGLKGTKEGCREGDCGACLVLLGGSAPRRDGAPDGAVEWRSVTSCTLAMGELDGKHLITIEGLASAGLTPVMEAMLDEGASQCGFCSPGFVLALTGFLVSGARVDPVEAMLAVEGNLCRCTGYGSIRRAAAKLAADFADLPASLAERLTVLAGRRVLPAGLAALMAEPPVAAISTDADSAGEAVVIGGGTDYFVRNPDPQPGLAPSFTYRGPEARSITRLERDGKRYVRLGPAVNATDFFGSAIVREAAPGIERHELDVASPPIRNRATLAGNVVNASPIADMTAMLMALGAELVLAGPKGERRIALERFFLGYKKVDLAAGESVAAIEFEAGWSRFAFEKASKRERLDIATVNCAVAVRMSADGSIADARYSAGGVAATPLRLTVAEAAMRGKRPSAALARELGAIAAGAGSPMSDVRGSSTYRVRLLERLAWAASCRLWPELKLEEELLA